MDHEQQDCVEQTAFELHSDITAGFYPESEPPTSEQLKLKAKHWPLLQLLGEERILVEKISSPEVDTSLATTSLSSALDHLKAISGPGLNPLIGPPLAPNTAGRSRISFL